MANINIWTKESPRNIAVIDVWNYVMNNKYLGILLEWVKSSEAWDPPVSNIFKAQEEVIKMVTNSKTAEWFSVEEANKVLEYAKTLPWFPWHIESPEVKWSKEENKWLSETKD